MNIAFHINILNSTSWRWISLSILRSKWGYPNGREKKVYSTVFCSKFKTECCRYATKKYWITIIFSDKYCETIIISLKFSSLYFHMIYNTIYCTCIFTAATFNYMSCIFWKSSSNCFLMLQFIISYKVK